jgi:5'-3' exonuclease
MLQLVENGKVIVYKPKVGVSPEKFYDEEAVKNQFGVSPKKLSLFRSFDGDNSDNITGVERVPRKLIARVVNASDSVESFYAELEKEKLTDFQKRSFAEGKERVETNLKIVALKKDLQDITHQISQIDKNKITELFKKFEIKSINPDVVVDIFSSVLNIRYTEARPSFKVESYSLF